MNMHKVVDFQSQYVGKWAALRRSAPFECFFSLFYFHKQAVNWVFVCPAEYSAHHQNICPLRCPSPRSLKKEAPSSISGAPCECRCACFNVLTDKNLCENDVVMALIKQHKCINVPEKNETILWTDDTDFHPSILGMDRGCGGSSSYRLMPVNH